MYLCKVGGDTFKNMENVFGKALSQKLKDFPMKPAELAELTKITRSNISRILNAKPHPISGAMPKVREPNVLKIAKALNWDEDEALVAAGLAPKSGKKIAEVSDNARAQEMMRIYDALDDQHKNYLLEIGRVLHNGMSDFGTDRESGDDVFFPEYEDQRGEDNLEDLKRKSS